VAGAVAGVGVGVTRQGETLELQGFLGPELCLPDRLVERPELLTEISEALRARYGLVAVTGIGGAGKSSLAALACLDRRVRRHYRDGIAWLEASAGQDPVELLATLAHRLGVPDAATSFATVEQGRKLLQPMLLGKRLLIAVDNVSERPLLDAVRDLTPTCTVLFSTRRAELAAMVKATQIVVDRLSQDQSLELLGGWTGQDPATLQLEARQLCAESGEMPLSVALAGGMVANGSSFILALDSVKQFPGEPDARSESSYEVRTVLHVIESGIAALSTTAQARYQELAIFAGRGPFPFHAAQALWRRNLQGSMVRRLLAELTGRALLTARGAGWYVAHDLQYEVLKGRLDHDGLAAAHAQLLDGYRIRYPKGWAESAGDPYLAANLASHLHEANLSGELRTVLTDTEWIQGRLTRGPIRELIGDYRYAGDPLTRQIMRTLRLSATSLTANPALIRSHLGDRLLSHPDPGITAWAAGLTDSTDSTPVYWLAPVIGAAVTQVDPVKQIRTGHTGPVRTVAVSEDGARAVSGSDDGTVRVWDLTTGRQQATLTGHTDWVRAVAVSQDGARAVSGSDDGTVRVWDLTTGTEQTALTGHAGEVFSVALTPDGTRAVSGGDDGTVRVWDLTADREEAAATGWIFSTAVTGDNARAVSGGSDGTLRVWDLATRREQATLTGHTRPVFGVALTPDGNRAVSGGSDRTVRVWDLTTGNEQAALTGHTRPVWSVAITPDGALAVSGSGDGTVRVWDLTTGKEQAALTGQAGEVFSVALTPDGTRAVSGGSDGTLRIWDLTTGTEQAVLSGHTRPVWSVGITPDGALAVSGSGDGTVRVWDLTTGNEQAALTALTGQAGEVFSVALTPDGTRAVSGGSDRTVRVWDVATGTELARWTADHAVIGCAALPGRSLKIGVGLGHGRPCVLELHVEPRRPASESLAGDGNQLAHSTVAADPL
jgi:WD40 repeat protein